MLFARAKEHLIKTPTSGTRRSLSTGSSVLSKRFPKYYWLLLLSLVGPSPNKEESKFLLLKILFINFRHRLQRLLIWDWFEIFVPEDYLSWYQNAPWKPPEERSNQKSYPADTNEQHHECSTACRHSGNQQLSNWTEDQQRNHAGNKTLVLTSYSGLIKSQIFGY